MLPSTCMCACVPTKVHLYMRIFLYINTFLCTNMFAKYVMHLKTYNGNKGNKKRSAQSKSMGYKKGSNQSDRSKLKRRVRVERCLPVGHVGEDGSSIRVLDHKKKTKRHKKENNQIITFRLFKAEINGRDGKMLTRGARRRKRLVNRSPR